MPVAARIPASLTEDVHARLRADLLACRLPPGQKLKIEALCLRLSAGSSAVREALSRLTSEGFVEATPRRGFRVKPLSLDELRDLTRTRCRIEALCIRDAIAAGDLEWETNLIGALHRLSRTPAYAADDPMRFSEAFIPPHTAFHEALVAACDSPWLLALRGLLFAQQERYRWLSRPLASVERDLATEHRQIAEAALERDAERCVALMDAHLTRTAEIVIEAVETGHARLAGGPVLDEPAQPALPRPRTASGGPR